MSHEFSEDKTEVKRRRASEMIAAGPDRIIVLQLIYDDDGNKVGLGFHQHMNLPTITEEGVSTEFFCDFVAMDWGQLVHIRKQLNLIPVRDMRTGMIVEDDDYESGS